MRTNPHLRRSKPGKQQGYILIALLFAVTLLLIALAAEAPRMGTQIRRQREDELIHRGNQYARAIQLFFRKFGRYPTSIDQLESTNNLRFLRKRYKDPITGSDDWKLVRFGQARVRPRPAYLKGATPAANLGGGIGSGALSGGPGGGGASGGMGTNASDISKPLGGSSTLGGGPIVGVASTSTQEGLKEYYGATKYNEWEFIYDPTLDPTSQFGRAGTPIAPGGGTPINPTPNPGPGPTGGVGSQNPR